MSASLMTSVLNGEISIEVLSKWLDSKNDELPDVCETFCCNRDEFVLYFLNYLRDQTESILNPKLTINTPEKNLLTPINTEPSNTDKKGRRVKTQLFSNSNISSDDSQSVVSSTPNKSESVTSPLAKSFDTPRCSNHSKNRSERSSFGEYLVTAQVKPKPKKKKTKQTETDQSLDQSDKIDLSSADMFPEIGAKVKKKRIKPTILTTKVDNSKNSFLETSVLAREENAVFKQRKYVSNEFSKTFDSERSVLKKEREKIIEKFTSTPKNFTPIPKKNVNEFVKIDSNLVTFKSKIDCLVQIYDLLFKNNLILSIASELYFLFSILISQQTLEEYNMVNQQTYDIVYLLRNINNAIYFSIWSLYNLRSILITILDETSLKYISHSVVVKEFLPELIAFFESNISTKLEVFSTDVDLDSSIADGMICFNQEKDSVENFPSVLSFQHFKKQRDMFYEILRWYKERGNAPKSSFRTRVKSLLSLSISASNHSHLARLYVDHMVAECLSVKQESKMSKLQKRLTLPTSQKSRQLPSFSLREMFYKDFLDFAENECFRCHVKDYLATEICVLNETNLTNMEDKNFSPQELSTNYVKLIKKLKLLAKFLGYTTDLPYSMDPVDYCIKLNNCMTGNREIAFAIPKGNMLNNEVSSRNYSQPALNLKEIILESQKKSRLTIVLPWIVMYLSMLHYPTLKIEYYKHLTSLLYSIQTYLKTDEQIKMKFNTVLYLKLTLGWLFDLPHFPRDVQKDIDISIPSELSIDSFLDIDKLVLLDLCPFLKDINILLNMARPIRNGIGLSSFRHITPLTMSIRNDEIIRNKEKEIQSRLEEALIKSMPASSRRVLEMVTDRTTSFCLKHIASNQLNVYREKCKLLSVDIYRNREFSGKKLNLTQAFKEMYENQFDELKHNAMTLIDAAIKEKVSQALTALLPSPSKPIMALAVKICKNNVNKWISNNWVDTKILCKNQQEEINIVMKLGETLLYNKTAEPNLSKLLLKEDDFNKFNISPTEVIIDLKEHICTLLEFEEKKFDIYNIMSGCLSVCSRENVFFTLPAQESVFKLTVDLCVVMVSRTPQELTEDFLAKINEIWDICCPDRQKHENLDESRISPERDMYDDRMPTPVSDDEPELDKNVSGISGKSTEILGNNTGISYDSKKYLEESDSIGSIKEKLEKSLNLDRSTENKIPVLSFKNEISVQYSDLDVSNSSFGDVSKKTCIQTNILIDYFNRILCTRNIMVLNSSRFDSRLVWEKMAIFLVFLLRNNYLYEDSLTEQCLGVYRQEWDAVTLQCLSTCMKNVTLVWSPSSTSKFHLFLEFLAEFCSDMNFDSFIAD